jgi:hypothetical protein
MSQGIGVDNVELAIRDGRRVGLSLTGRWVGVVRVTSNVAGVALEGTAGWLVTIASNVPYTSVGLRVEVAWERQGRLQPVRIVVAPSSRMHMVKNARAGIEIIFVG